MLALGSKGTYTANTLSPSPQSRFSIAQSCWNLGPVDLKKHVVWGLKEMTCIAATVTGQVTLQRKREGRDSVHAWCIEPGRPRPLLAFASGRMVFGLLGFGNSSHWFSRCRPVSAFFADFMLHAHSALTHKATTTRSTTGFGHILIYSRELPDLVLCFAIVYCMIAVIVVYGI